jgi:hypothetical protein
LYHSFSGNYFEPEEVLVQFDTRVGGQKQEL